LHGRVAALLELGAGFNNDFSGRENIYLNAALLGLTRAEIEEKLMISLVLRISDILLTHLFVLIQAGCWCVWRLLSRRK
jgi:hypothetical protein